MKKHIFIFLIMLVAFHLQAEPTFKTHLNTDIDDNDKKCSTVGFYDANTSVTFFGDSRIDLVDMPLYGASSLDFYLLTLGAWNTQNFGVSGMNSSELKDQIQTCFRRDPNDVTKPAYPNFKIAYNVAFEIGGNDYWKNTPLFIFNPVLYTTRVPQTRDNIASVIYTLQKRERNVLLIGNYPAVSWSVRLGDPKDYAGYNVVNPKVLQAYSIIVKKDVYKEAREMVKEFISKLIITSKLLPTTWSALGSFIDTLSEEENSELNKIYKQGIQAVETIQKKPDVSQVSLGNYTWWQYISSRALATAASIGIVFLEHELRKMVDNPREYGLEPFYYISTGEYFLHSSAKFEPWVANPDLMTDLIHKNHLGYAVWGVLVGNKIREIGWQNKKGVDDSIGSKKFHSMIQSLLNSVRARYEGRLKEIERELESQIASLRERAKERLSAASNGLRSINEQLAELEREAARKREEARIQYERERIAAEEEARRLEAEWRLRQEENARLERERLAAEEEARRRREQEEMLLNVAACFFFGWCKR